jgi:DNA-binding NarL/FixJ family response regulator
MRPLLDQGNGVAGYDYDTTRPYAQWLSPPVGDPQLTAAVTAAFPDTPREINDLIHRRAGPITILSELMPGPPAKDDGLGPHARAFEIADVFGVNAANPNGRGTYFMAPSARRLRRSDATIARWQQVAAHLAAAGRLRRVLADERMPDAVLAPDGRVLHAERSVRASLPSLQRATRAAERARSQRADLDALASWRALVDGRWSMIDEVEHDGRRILLVHANPPDVADPRKLTMMERIVAGYVVMGHSNKLIAYELGIATSTVALHLQGVARKLGVRTRVEVIDRILLIAAGEARAVAIDDEVVTAIVPPAPASTEEPADARLSPAELAVARLAARGVSNARIAATRGVAVRTVANQLASIYSKLAIGSRAELARCFAPDKMTMEDA